MAGTIKRGKVIRADLANWDGKTATYSRIDATGGTVSGLPIGNEVDVLQVDGSGTDRTRASILNCINRIGSTSVTLVFAPGTWTIDDNLTIASNFSCRIPAGCIFNVSSGKTLTFSGPVYAESSTYSSGAGSVSIGLTSDAIIGGVPWIKRTAAEIAAGVTPTDYAKAPLPIIDIRRHGFAESRTEAQNAASIEEAMSVLRQESALGGIIQLPPGKFNVDPFVITQRITVRGAGSQATWLTNGDAATFITLGASANSGALKYGCGLSDVAVFCNHRNGNAIYLRECESAYLSNIYAENNSRTGNTDTCACVTIDGGNISSFFNVLNLVVANHWHYGYRLLTSGTTYPTQTTFLQCSAFGDVATDNASIGLDIAATGGMAQQSAWHGGNIERCATGVKHGGGSASLMFFGLRTEANTIDVEFGALCNAQAYTACLLDPAKITDNSGNGFERHTFFACHTPTGAQFGNKIPGASEFRAAASAAEIPVTIRGYPGQTAKLLKVVNSASAELYGVDSAGNIFADGNVRVSSAATGAVGTVTFGDTTQTTVGAAGGASALPATPTGYLRFFVGTTEFVIPYYAQA